jgi:hypothetical protein
MTQILLLGIFGFDDMFWVKKTGENKFLVRVSVPLKL